MAIVEANTELGREVVADAKRYILHSWSVQDALDPIPVAGADGRHFWDYDGKRYLDFASQLVNVSIGHQHPKVIAAIKEQAEKLCTIGPPMATEPRSELARLLAEVTPGNLAMSFFTNGGAEANENAIKLARWYTGRPKIVARYRSYHGATVCAITATGDPRRWAAEPGIPRIVRLLDPYTYRFPAGHPHRREGDQLRLRAARRDGDLRADRRVGARQDVRRRAHVQRSSARVRLGGRVDRGVPRGGDRRERRRDGRGVRGRAAEARRAAPVDRRGARPRLLLGARAGAEPGDEGAARPVQRERRGSRADRAPVE